MAEFTANFTLSEIETIDATFVIYQDVTKTSQLENDSNFVSDTNYVHTDNNLTDILKTNYDIAYTNNHTHSNKIILDNTTASFTITQETNLSNQSGMNTGDETQSSIIAKIGYTPSNSTNTPIISSGNGAPTSTPTKIGDVYVDTTLSTHPVFYTANGNTSSANWIKQNDTYFIQFGVGAHKALNASTTYSFGAIYSTGGLQPSTDYGRTYVPKSGIIKKVNFNSLTSPLGSAGVSSLYLRVNNSKNYLISDQVNLSSTLFKFDQFDTNIEILEGQLINLNLVTGAYTTAPSVSCNAQLLIET